jgi:sterol desaturase/sphingolipid hydroxylase (fatty acid hydroxylase superfamily)
MFSLIIVYSGLLVLGPIFSLFQWRCPATQNKPLLSRERATDFYYWLLSPLFTGALTRASLLGFIGLIAFLRNEVLFPESLLFFNSTPLWLQGVFALLVADFVGYWSHRMRHQRYLWPFHAIHHSAKSLDWLAAARMHPVDDILDNFLIGIALVLLGFDYSVIFALGPFFILHTIMLHANVSWDFGPLKYVLVSPYFHRWHHADDRRARSKNFSGIFSFYDKLFGTLYFPEKRQPASFGAGDAAVPAHLIEQLLYPFRGNLH